GAALFYSPVQPDNHDRCGCPGIAEQSHARRSSALRDLIEKSGDATDPSIPDDGKIRTFDRTVSAVRAQSPREADVVAISVGLADQLKPEIRKALLDAGDQRVNAVMAVAAHEGVGIFRIAGPVRGQHLAPAAWRSFVPQIDIAAGNGIEVGHLLSPSMVPSRSADRLSKVRATQSITSRVMDFGFGHAWQGC